MYDMKGRVALVTGAGSGIGQATAIGFAHQGAHVVVVDYTPNGGSDTVKAIEDAGTEALFTLCDVRKADQVARVIDETRERFGRLDYAFNNAGVEGTPAPTADCSEENWDHTLDTNLKGVWLSMRYEIPLMLETGGGAIVNCSSVAGLVGIAAMPAYVASKHGVNGLTKTAALDHAGEGIRINAVCPGAIQTPMIERFTHGDAAAEAAMVAAHPIGRMGVPDEIASAVLWLCSDGASFVTGQTLAIDGGWTTR